ncbi:M23 family metallopeptidase [Streptacidiphilus sp. EB129]|uniref:M23 family metallopeptidase n=1 Tax=Streptacidiphilus sp. EB129 TaxID=3156262 RepID=UPI00351788ED
MASYQPTTWAPEQSDIDEPETPRSMPRAAAPQPAVPQQRSSGIAPSAVLGFAAMAAVGATGLAAPASAFAAEPGSAAKGTLIAHQDRSHQDHGQTVGFGSNTAANTDPGTALAERIRNQAAQQKTTAEDTARRQAAQAAAEKQARLQQLAAEAEQQAAQAAAGSAAQAAAQRSPGEQTAAAVEAALRAHRPQAVAQLGTLVAPVPGATTGAGFGQSDSFWAHLHTGLDLTAPTGAPVLAIGAGTVTSAGWAGAYGYRVVETMPDGTELWYCHLSAIGVGSGEVTAGQPIGRVGATGNAAGPHLHLEVRPAGGEPVDPAGWLADHGLAL